MTKLTRVPKPPRKIKRTKSTTRPVKRPRPVKSGAGGVSGRPRSKNGSNRAAANFGRKAGKALSGAVDSAMPQIMRGDFAGAYETILAKIKGELLDTLNRSLASVGLPPVSDSGPDADYFRAAVLAKSGLEINDLTVGGLKDFGEKMVWTAAGKSVGIDLTGVTGVEDAITRCVDSVTSGKTNVSVVLSIADKERARVANAIKSAGKTFDDYEKALSRRRASESGRNK